MERISNISRETKETRIQAALWLSGGPVKIDTGIGFFDHMLHAWAFYAGFGLTLTAKGDLEVDGHHTVEDTYGRSAGLHGFGLLWTAFPGL